MTLTALITSLKTRGVLRSVNIKRALARIDRKKFVADAHQARAYDDIPLPIGEGQTISQPYTVVFMLELLQPKGGEHIVDIGAGSGWQTCLLAHIVGSKGKVYAIERVPALCKLGTQHIAQFPECRERIELFCQNAQLGLSHIAGAIGGFDAIIAAAEVQEVPDTWRRQLKVGGRLVYPKSASVFREVKKKDGTFRVDAYPNFAFVPFVSETVQ